MTVRAAWTVFALAATILTALLLLAATIAHDVRQRPPAPAEPEPAGETTAQAT